jgi:hypothetical protein
VEYVRRQFPRETDCLLSQGAATGTVVSKAVESGGEELSNLEYPKAMSAGEREEAGKNSQVFLSTWHSNSWMNWP